MNSQENINLFKKDFYQKPEFVSAIESQVKKTSLVILFVVMLIGVITVSLYMFMDVRHRLLANTKEKLLEQLTKEKTKESIFLTIKSRVGVVSDAMKLRVPVADIVRNAQEIALPPKLEKISYEGERNVSVQYSPTSIDDAIDLTAGLVKQLFDEKIKNPKIGRFSISEDGLIITYLYSPVM